ncbi:hypothetical protein C2845_PM02G01740 [Panicum miliaceum]|uniref:Uncharacterized protein n=1 Tax=Panicum miliaceum TaxID=4540 RepID=A0A3L6SBX0_PANMI|nr:hypothetical protein C2845_PM02G01740 [Panicum miliaceum]
MHNTYIQPQCPATPAIDRAPTFPPRHTHAPDTSLIPPSYLFTAPNRSDEEHRHHAPVARHPARTHHRRQANTLGRGDEQIPDTNTGIPLPCRVRVVCSSTVVLARLRGRPAAARAAASGGLLRPALDGVPGLRGLVARVRRGLRHPAARLLHVVRGALERLPRRVGEARERGEPTQAQRARREEPRHGHPDEQRGRDEHRAEDQEHRGGHGEPHHGGRQREARQHQQQPAQREQRRHRQRLRRRGALVVDHALHLLPDRPAAAALLAGVGAAVDAAARVAIRHC